MTDGNGFVAEDDIDVIVEPLPTALAGGNQTICVNETATVSGASSSNGTIQWTENGAGSITSGATTLTPTYTAAAGDAGNTVTLTMTVTSNNSCGTATATATYTVNVLPLPTVVISGTTAVCQNDAPNPVVTITNPMALPVTVTYNVNSIGTTSIIIAANSNVTISQPTSNAGIFNYNMESVAYQSAPTCSNSVTGTATITVHPTPTVNAVADLTLCNDVQYSGFNFSGPVAGTTFAWTNSNPAIGLAAGGTGNIPAFNPINGTNGPITGIITVTPTANGCVGTTETFTITVNPTATATISGSTTVCQNAASPVITFTNPLALPVTITFRRNSVVQPTINVAANSSSSLTVPTNTAGVFTFDLVSAAFQSGPLCTNGISGSATVTVNPIPNVGATPAAQTICSSDAITLIQLTGSTPGATYNWVRNNTISVTGIGASGTGDISGTLTNTTSSPVTVTFTITPTFSNCSGNTVTATVIVNPIPVATVTPATQIRCSGEAISSLVPSSSTGGTTFTWTRDNIAEVTGIAASGAGSVPTVTLTNTTSAPVTVTFTFYPRANNCDGLPVTATVLVNPTPNINNLTETICNSGTFNITPVDGVDGVVPSGTSYSWAIQSATGGITGAGPGTGTTITGTLGNSTNLLQTVTYAVTPTYGICRGELFLLVVNVTPEPDINDLTINICSNGSFNITPVNGTNGIVPSGTSYDWVVESTTGNVSGEVDGSGTSISGNFEQPRQYTTDRNLYSNSDGRDMYQEIHLH